MTRLHLLLISALAASLTVALLLGGNAFAARGDVTCKLEVKHGKHVVSCPKGQLRGKRGRRGARGARGAAGAAGPTGPAGAPAGSGSGLNLNFNAYLSASEKKEVTIGNFTIRAASDALGNCAPIVLRAGAVDSRFSHGSAGAFALLLNNTIGTVAAANTSDMFTAVSENGVSTMSGIVGAVTAGGVCLVSGYVTGR
jgi:hypothetical protein